MKLQGKKELSSSCPRTLICSASGFLFWYEMIFCHRNMYSSATNTVPIISWREIITDANWLAALISFQPFYLKIKMLLMFLRHNVSNKTTKAATKIKQHFFYTIGWTDKFALMYPATEEWSCTLRSNALAYPPETSCIFIQYDSFRHWAPLHIDVGIQDVEQGDHIP